MPPVCFIRFFRFLLFTFYFLPYLLAFLLYTSRVRLCVSFAFLECSDVDGGGSGSSAICDLRSAINSIRSLQFTALPAAQSPKKRANFLRMRRRRSRASENCVFFGGSMCVVVVFFIIFFSAVRIFCCVFWYCPFRSFVYSLSGRQNWGK